MKKIIVIFITCLIISGCSKPAVEIPIPDETPSNRVNHTLREEKKEPKLDNQVKLEKLQAENKDVIATIQIPDTLLDYPLMYREGIEEYYLRKDIYEEYDIGGLPFMQQNCSLYDNNLFIYGHYFMTGEMFGCLHNYVGNTEFYETHKDIIVTTPTEIQTWRIFAVCEMNIDDNGFVYNAAEYINFNTKSEFEQYISYVQGKNNVQTDEYISYGERMMFLSTCYDYSGSSKRIVVFAKQI